ncbi:MAG: OmpA family protein [Alphaproteobacteria bacterium]
MFSYGTLRWGLFSVAALAATIGPASAQNMAPGDIRPPRASKQDALVVVQPLRPPVLPGVRRMGPEAVKAALSTVHIRDPKPVARPLFSAPSATAAASAALAAPAPENTAPLVTVSSPCVDKAVPWVRRCVDAGYPAEFTGDIHGETRVKCGSGELQDVWLANTCGPAVTAAAEAQKIFQPVSLTNRIPAAAPTKIKAAAAAPVEPAPHAIKTKAPEAVVPPPSASSGDSVTVATADASCGAAVKTATIISPTQDLCAKGSPSQVTGEGPWNWTCADTQARLVSCTVNLPVLAECGTANNMALPSAPTIALCNAGTPGTVLGSGPWRWICDGGDGGTSVQCMALVGEKQAMVSEPSASPVISQKTEEPVSFARSEAAPATDPAKNAVNEAKEAEAAKAKEAEAAKIKEIEEAKAQETEAAKVKEAEESRIKEAETVKAKEKADKEAAVAAAAAPIAPTVLPAINGACGEVSNVAVSEIPASHFCASGLPGEINGRGPWNWQCAGVNGGVSISCNAPYLIQPIAPPAYEQIAAALLATRQKATPTATAETVTSPETKIAASSASSSPAQEKGVFASMMSWIAWEESDAKPPAQEQAPASNPAVASHDTGLTPPKLKIIAAHTPAQPIPAPPEQPAFILPLLAKWTMPEIVAASAPQPSSPPPAPEPAPVMAALPARQPDQDEAPLTPSSTPVEEKPALATFLSMVALSPKPALAVAEPAIEEPKPELVAEAVVSPAAPKKSIFKSLISWVSPEEAVAAEMPPAEPSSSVSASAPVDGTPKEKEAPIGEGSLAALAAEEPVAVETSPPKAEPEAALPTVEPPLVIVPPSAPVPTASVPAPSAPKPEAKPKKPKHQKTKKKREEKSDYIYSVPPPTPAPAPIQPPEPVAVTAPPAPPPPEKKSVFGSVFSIFSSDEPKTTAVEVEPIAPPPAPMPPPAPLPVVEPPMPPAQEPAAAPIVLHPAPEPPVFASPPAPQPEPPVIVPVTAPPPPIAPVVAVVTPKLAPPPLVAVPQAPLLTPPSFAAPAAPVAALTTPRLDTNDLTPGTQSYVPAPAIRSPGTLNMRPSDNGVAKLHQTGHSSIISLEFSEDSEVLKSSVLDGIASAGGQLADNPGMRLTVIAYAKSGDAREARRLSLARALAVRDALIAVGARSEQITLRAMGANTPDDHEADRVDLVAQ